MENIKDNKNINYILKDNKYLRETISNINHTNINNNINITNYYPSPSQEYCNKETFTFINDNGNVDNAMNYPIKTKTHKTKKMKESSLIPIPSEKKYHQCKSPYMKKILPNTQRQKSEDGNRIIKIYKNSPSYKFIQSTKKNQIKNQFFNEISYRKSETQNNTNNKSNKSISKDKYYLDFSNDEIINNKYKSNKDFSQYYYTNNTNNTNNSEINIIKYDNNKFQNKSKLYNNNSAISYESNGKESLFNKNRQKPYQVSYTKRELLYRISPINKKIFSQKCLKNQNNIKINYKKEISVEKKVYKYIILIQSFTRGYLLRLKLAQYLNLYERIKKAVSLIYYIIFHRKRFVFYFITKININRKISKYYIMNSNFPPINNISLEYNELKNNNKNKIIRNESLNIKNNKDKNIYQIKINDSEEFQKEINKKKIDLAVAEKKIKELLKENKKIQNINNIIVRDNKQLALKLKNSEKRNFNKLKIQNNYFSVNNKLGKNINNNHLKIKINNLLTKIITRKIISIKAILYKYFYKFNFKSKMIYMYEINNKNNKNNLFIENNNNFVINDNNKKQNSIIINNKLDIEKRNRQLKNIIKKKDINLYLYRNIFEKWMMRSLIFKSKDFVKEKKKKKKEKFKQRKQKKMYGYLLDKNDKKNYEDNENENENSGDSDDFEVEQKYNSNKSGSNKRNNKYYYDDKK